MDKHRCIRRSVKQMVATILASSYVSDRSCRTYTLLECGTHRIRTHLLANPSAILLTHCSTFASAENWLAMPLPTCVRPTCGRSTVNLRDAVPRASFRRDPSLSRSSSRFPTLQHGSKQKPNAHRQIQTSREEDADAGLRRRSKSKYSREPLFQSTCRGLYFATLSQL